ILVSNPAGWAFGERVVVSGQPQYSSYGAGTTGAAVSNYAGYITGLNLGSGIKYPIHVDQLGWFAESQTRRDSAGTGSGGTASVQQRVPGFTIQTKFIRENWRGDGKDEVLDCGQFELDAVTVEGPPDVINIKATSLPYGTQIRQTEKNRAWESVSLSEIAGEIARGGGMTCMYESAFNPFYDRQEQIKTSDIKFLSGLCRRAGLSLKVTNNIIVIFEQAAFEKKPPVFHIQKGDGSYSRYKLDTRETGTRYDSCLVSYTDPANGRKIEAVAYADGAGSASLTRPTLRIGDRGEDVRYMQRLLADRGFRQRSGIDGIFGADTKESVRLFQKSINMRGDGVCGPKTWEALELSASPSSNLSVNGQQLRITAKVSSIAEAKTLAEKLLRLKNKSGLPANYTIPFHPGWVAGITGTLGGWGTWDGKYIVSQSRHTVGGSNSSTQISLRQVLEGY
ncbi:MAG: peptidoglycan-binding protein, partial [Oscillospiraceae bacterium]|nr:peptidoglycan-binding protein [Oscillospiraceae bacterium]